MKETRANILFVEDDINLGFVVKDNLEEAGFAVTHCTDGAEAMNTWQYNSFDLCVLDVMLPQQDGFALAKFIRQTDTDIPIIFLSAKAMKEDKLTGFKAGADDYITKPFSIEELLMRIEVFLRRRQNSVPTVAKVTSHYAIGQYLFKYENLELIHAQETISLTQREADLLRIFYQHLDQTLRREQILTLLWGNDDYFSGRSLDVFISKLRKYLRHDESIEITNQHGVGFRLCIKKQ